jgi:hypothetical protein
MNMNVIYEEKEEVSECVDIPMKQHKIERYACAHTQPQGSKSAKFFSERSGAERWSGSRKNKWSGGAVTSKKFGAERSGNFRKFRFFGVFHEIFAKNCSKGTKRSQITPDALAR